MKYNLISIILFFSSLIVEANSTKKIQAIIDGLPKSTKVSVYIFDATTDKNIIKNNIGKSMIPASNTKLFTTAAALNLMGSKHKFVTKVITNDLYIKNGVVEGNLYIKGFGHSTFTTRDLDSLVLLIRSAGVKLIKGNIIGDDSYFDKLYTRDDWIIDERANVKLPPVSALVINKNQFVISLSSTGKIGNKLRYSIKPECSFINVDMTAKVTGNRSRPRIRSSFIGKKINVKVSGGLRKRRTSRSYVVNISNPPLYFALLLKERLQINGIKVIGNAQVGISPNSFSDLANVDISLDTLISLVNKNSNNYMAECLFKSLGAFYSGEEGNSFYATQAVLSAFEDEYIIDDATAVVDGSGISRFNTVTTGSIGRLLYKVYKNELLYEFFFRSLSISGIDGTLKDRPINNFIKGNFHGKTGTLNGVTALSGYLTGKNNHTYIISLIMEYKTKGSNYHKNIEDRILLELSK
jgi:serine-type D-Ala-D-Ala carboxypeptidase/endopeptidase (penicillin-binding protein 4)